jgi:capsular exopolysaccharide synthesis family protein
VTPVEPVWLKNIVWGIIGGLVAGISLCFILESIDTTITTLKDVSDFCRMPALGIVPKIADPNGRIRVGEGAKSAAKLRIHTLEHPQSEVSDAYRNLRTSLMLSSPGAPPRILLVTSALPREGKTTTTVNTAVVFAQKNQRVLLVDGDLRRGDLRQYFDFQRNEGLSEVLAGKEPNSFYVQDPRLPNLYILPAGTRPPQPPDMLDSERMRQLVKRWREEFDTVIIDSPPVIGMSDAVILSTMADSVVLVVRARQSRRQEVNRALEILRTGSARLSGIIINDLDALGSGYYGDDASLYHHYFNETGGTETYARQ